MKFNMPQFFLNVFIIFQVAFSGGFAFVDNSQAAVNRRFYEEYQDKRYGNRNKLANNFEFAYKLKAEDKDTINQFQPLLIDYTLFQYFYVESSNVFWNPIRPYELHNTKFFFEFSALNSKGREQVFVDLYIKYNAAFAFLHLWITRYIIRKTILKVPEDKAGRDSDIHKDFLLKCDEMTFYAYWLVDIEIHRHLDELDSKLRSVVPKDKTFPGVIEAFEKIIKTLKGLVEIEPFISPIRHRIFYFNQKENPFDLRIAPVQIEQQEDKWMRILEFAEKVNQQKNPHIQAENFFKQWYDADDDDSDEAINKNPVEDLTLYMKYLHDNSWSAIKMAIGNELFIMESFFYTTLTGMPYSIADSFIKPDFSFTTNLWKELECIYFFWNPATATKATKTESDKCKMYRKSFYSKDTAEESKMYFITILREIDGLRFRKSSLISLNANFTLKTCSECFFRCRCIGSFRMVH